MKQPDEPRPTSLGDLIDQYLEKFDQFQAELRRLGMQKRKPETGKKT
jgi:hypothetical protein